MPNRLPAVLSIDDLPEAELAAARLDGELFSIDACYSPIDEIEGPSHRALALGSGQASRLIAEQLSAAWVWGVTSRAPVPPQFCVATAARVRASGSGWTTVREVVISETEICILNGVSVTSPLRTAVDILRFSESFDHGDAAMIRGLMALGSFGAPECIDSMNRRKNLPNKLTALQRLSRC